MCSVLCVCMVHTCISHARVHAVYIPGFAQRFFLNKTYSYSKNNAVINIPVFAETLVYVEEPSTHQFTVQRSGKLDSAVSVAYRTLDGSASTLEGDYQAIFRETLNFASGESTKTVSVTVLDDVLPEGNETITLELFDATGENVKK